MPLRVISEAGSLTDTINIVEKPDFGAEVTNNLLIGTHLGPLIKHANWALTLVNALPESFSGRWIPGTR